MGMVLPKCWCPSGHSGIWKSSDCTGEEVMMWLWEESSGSEKVLETTAEVEESMVGEGELIGGLSDLYWTFGELFTTESRIPVGWLIHSSRRGLPQTVAFWDRSDRQGCIHRVRRRSRGIIQCWLLSHSPFLNNIQLRIRECRKLNSYYYRLFVKDGHGVPRVERTSSEAIRVNPIWIDCFFSSGIWKSW